MELHSDRLYMRQIKAGDWALFQALHDDPRVIEYVCDAPSMTQLREKFESRLPQWHPGADHWLCLVVFDRHGGYPVGVTGLKLTAHATATAEVGYLFLPDHQGKGYASESLRGVMGYARDIVALTALQGIVTDGNVASCRVLEKCGFVLAQRLAGTCQINGQVVDDLIYHHRLSES